jgi:AraC-like DNA-binding protein
LPVETGVEQCERLTRATTVIPRYFQDTKKLKCLKPNQAYGVEFRFNLDVTRYNLIATSHAIVFILSGEKTIHWPGGDIELGAGSLVFIPRGSYITSDVRGCNNEFRRLVLFFEDAFLKDFLSLVAAPPSAAPQDCPLVTIPISELLSQAIESLQPYLDDSLSYGEHLMKTKLHEILLNVLENDSCGQLHAALAAAVSAPKAQLRHFMQSNFTRPLSVAEFARLSCRSPRQFGRDFRMVFNQTPAAWILDKRLEFAHHLLCASPLTLTEICYSSGFCSYSHFIQQFRRKYAITPKRLQAQNR